MERSVGEPTGSAWKEVAVSQLEVHGKKWW